MNLGLEHRVAIVTGASRGLGKATAEALAAEGARVIVVARNAPELSAIEAAYPGQVIALPGDVTAADTARRAVEAALAAFGRLDIMVANTPGPPPMEPFEAGEAEFAAAFDTVFYPALRLIRAAAVPMSAAGWGRIIIVSSTSVKAPKSFLCLSAATRSALWAWAKSAAPELYGRGVTINAVFAGPHKTDRARQLNARTEGIGLPEDFGALLATMCGDASRFVTGTGYVLDGGEMRGLL